ncbi:MAG: NUDIX domain-containing protein [Agathobacter sp.]|nr:NUDIX domain-containing protein [Agathobacter sp.]
MDELEVAIEKVREIVKKRGIDFRDGLPEPLFEFATSLMPTPNIDLLIINDNGEVLLTWRSDKYYGTGWHIPGGCIRIQETLDERIQKTALSEIGSSVIYNKNPIVTREAFMKRDRPWLKDQLERSHNISILYEARLPDGFQINNGDKSEHDAGYMKWFSEVPDDLLPEHQDLYIDIIRKYLNLEEK